MHEDSLSSFVAHHLLFPPGMSIQTKVYPSIIAAMCSDFINSKKEQTLQVWPAARSQDTLFRVSDITSMLSDLSLPCSIGSMLRYCFKTGGDVLHVRVLNGVGASHSITSVDSPVATGNDRISRLTPRGSSSCS